MSFPFQFHTVDLGLSIRLPDLGWGKTIENQNILVNSLLPENGEVCNSGLSPVYDCIYLTDERMA